MKRTGNHPFTLSLSKGALVSLLALAPAAALAEAEFYMTVDRNEVGTEDTFRLTVVASDAPEGAHVQLPAPKDFEVLSTNQSTQMSFRMGGGAGGIQRVQKWVLVMRANHPGHLTIPPAVMTTATKSFRADPIKMEVKKGRVADPRAAAPPPPQRLPDPFQNFPFPGMPEDLEEFFPEPEIPRSDSDLFLKAHVDKTEVYLGEQLTLSHWIFSRIDISSVDAINMPKLEGFWSEDLDSPTQLGAEQRVIGGVPYRAYLVKRRALFPVKPGTITIGAAEADITTGFLFQGQRVHRKGNALEVKVKPLSAGGPPGAGASAVGRWRLNLEVSQTTVKLGEPITFKVILEGRGNVKNVAMPALTGPASLKIYDPTTTDKVSVNKGALGGRRVQEYLVMPQQTGSFVISGLSFPFFDPESKRWDESRTDPVTLTVTPGDGNAQVKTVPGNATAGTQTSLADPVQKNKLEATGLKPLRYQAAFQPEPKPLWRRAFFVPVAAAPLAAWLGVLAVGFIRAAFSGEDPASKKRKQARAARARLAAAEKLKAAGKPAEFYGEIEKALYGFLEAKLGVPTIGLTRDKLVEAMSAASVPAERQRQILAALEMCDHGRYAPGGGGAARGKALDEAAAAMEGA